jgi:hypothetical protein
VSILPIPVPISLPDGHCYAPFQRILEHALMMKQFKTSENKDPKWKSLASSNKFQTFLRNIHAPDNTRYPSLRQLAVGLLLWTDGWDTSTGCKSNRSPMHTGTVTLLIVEVETHAIVGIATYPNMGGPGKIDHEPVFLHFQQDITDFQKETSNRVFISRHHRSEVEVHTKLLFVVQDQPERRGVSGLLRGGSRLHPVFGLSCDFSKLVLPFEACQDCINRIDEYLETKNRL